MKKIYLLCWLMALSTFGRAQTIEIPAGNPVGNDDRHPFANWWGYERSAMLYLSSEINTAGSLNGVGFYVNSNVLPSGTTNPIKIYVKETTASTLSSSLVSDEETGATLVYDGPLNIGAAQAGAWVTQAFTTPFAYTGGANNLEIIIENNIGGTGVGTSTDLYFRHSPAGATMYQNWNADNTPPGGTGTTSNNRPNVQLIFAPSQGNDVGVQAIVNPRSGCGLSANETVTVTVRNYGTNPQSNIPVTFSINGTVIGNEVIPGPIASATAINYSFTTTANLGTVGTYTVSARTNLTGDATPTNDIASKTVNGIQAVSTFPYSQGFENGPDGWVAGGTSSSWALGTPAKPIINSAASGTKSWITNLTSDYNNSEQSYVASPCFNMSTLAQPVISLKIWWNSEHNYDKAALLSSIDGGATWQKVGAFGDPDNWYNNNSTLGPGVNSFYEGWSGRASTTDGSNGWVLATHKLNGLGGQASVMLRVAFGTDGSGVDDGFAFDDISIYEAPANDLELTAITAPVKSGCGFSASENVTVAIKNVGSAPTSTFNLKYEITNVPSVNPVTETVNAVIAPGATYNYTFTAKANLGTVGTYNFVATALLANDGNASNDIKTKTVTVIPTVSTFPYSQNFENGAGGWVSGGVNSSWALGTPAKTVINSAASGTNSWITNLSANYNSNEQSYVVGPCFNFSGIADPDFEMKIWWITENNFDKAALQSSIDGGATWQHVGALNDPNNWYNNNSTSGPGIDGVKLGWSGDPGSGGWVLAKHKLTGLGYQSSVLLRVAFGTDGSGVRDGFAFDDIRIGDNTGNLSINSFVPLTQICGFGSNEKVEVVIENLGSVPATGFTLSYSVDGGPSVPGQAVTAPLLPNTPVNYTFQQGANLSAPGNHTIVVTLTTPNDPELVNNTITYSIANAAYATIPPVFNFETTATGIASLRLVTPSKGTIVENAAASNGAGSTKGMIMAGITDGNWTIPAGATDPWTTNLTHLTGAYICFNPAGGNPSDSLIMTLDLMQLYKTANANTNFRVTVNGLQVGPTYRPPFAGGTPAWKTIYVDLTPYASLSNIQIGLESSVMEEYASGNGTANLIDNVNIRRIGLIIGVKNDILQNQVAVYPNPSTGIFNVTLPTTGKQFSLEVSDLTGKLVKQQTATGTDKAALLKLQNLPKGIYQLKISSEGSNAVKKLIVQ